MVLFMELSMIKKSLIIIIVGLLLAGVVYQRRSNKIIYERFEFLKYHISKANMRISTLENEGIIKEVVHTWKG